MTGISGIDRSLTGRRLPLSDHHPARLQNRIRDQTHDGRCRDECGIVHFPAEQNGKRYNADQSREPVTDSDFAEQEARAENGADRGRVSAFDETLYVGVAAMPRKQWRSYKDKDE